MTEKPKAEVARALAAEILLSIGTGVAIALVINAALKYGRSDGKSR